MGGFYVHFASRAELVGEAIAFAMDQTTEHWKQITKGGTAQERLDALLADYLSSRHRDDTERACPLPALAADIGRSNLRTRRAFTSRLEHMIDLVAEFLADHRPQHGRQVATGIVAHGRLDCPFTCG